MDQTVETLLQLQTISLLHIHALERFHEHGKVQVSPQESLSNVQVGEGDCGDTGENGEEHAHDHDADNGRVGIRGVEIEAVHLGETLRDTAHLELVDGSVS